MMIRGIKYLLVLFFALGLCSSSFAKDEDTVASKIDRANKYYQQQDYENAIKSYEEVLKAGKISPAVYYNLANAYYKNGSIAKSILNFERARKLAPNDEDIDFNQKVASLKVVDKIDPIPMVFYKHWISSVAMAMDMNVWSKISIGLIWITVLLFAAFTITSGSSGKKLFFILGITFFVLSLASFYFTSVENDLVNHDQHAVVTSASSYIKSSPDEKGNDQFILHEGTKVEVLDEYNDWNKIKIANGSVGWIKSKEIEVI